MRPSDEPMTQSTFQDKTRQTPISNKFVGLLHGHRPTMPKSTKQTAMQPSTFSLITSSWVVICCQSKVLRRRIWEMLQSLR